MFDRSTAVRWGLFLFLGVLALSIPQAAIPPLLDRDEPRFAEASREMYQSGNFVVPTFNGAPRYAKPPLIYWAQAACFSVLGENAFAARLPSLLATAATALLLFYWGRVLLDLPTGLIAGVSYAFCFQAMQQGRAATADALLVFFTTLTALAGWKLLALRAQGNSRAWCGWGMVLALAFAGGFLAKGPEALLPIVPMIWLARGSGARVLLSLLAIFALGLLVVSGWAIPAYLQTHGAYWREGLGHEVGDRMVTGFQGHGASSFGWYLLSLPFYLLLFWVSALPWSVLLWKQRRPLLTWKLRDETDVYLLLNAAVIFVIFSLMVTKLPSYTLPALPLLALLFAKRWTYAGQIPQTPVKAGLCMGIGFAMVALILIPLLLPGANPSPAGTLVRAAGDKLSPDAECALVDYREPNTVWELRKVARGYSRTLPEGGVIGFLRLPGPRAVILTSMTWQKIHPAPDYPLRWHVYRARGWNAGRLSFVDLTLVTTD